MKNTIIIGLILITAIFVAGQNTSGKSVKQPKEEQEMKAVRARNSSECLGADCYWSFVSYPAADTTIIDKT